MTSQTFEAFGFAEPLNRALTQCGYQTPTPIQVQALSPQLEGRDLLGMAETGSGKTATFVLPILQKIAANPADLPWKGVNALILAPTRELAIQIDQEVASLSRNMNIRRAVVLGGVSKGPQINALKRGVHVLVATPGRLLDHVNMRSCDLSGVQTLVIDEADRMFDMGFIRDIKKIVSLIPMKRRTALFSATMPTEIKKFAYDILQDPYRVDLSTKTMVVDRIDQKVMIVRTAEKQSRLHTILKDEACQRVIVFTRTKRGADRVAERLAMAGIGAVAFHGNKAQNARQRALNDFTAGHVRVLVATDIAARGIDVSNVTHVINFDMPLDPETYVHRVGRTARKGTSGIAISLCDNSERQEIKAIERLMKQSIEVIDDVGGENLPMPERRASHDQERPRRDGGFRRGGPGQDRGREGGNRFGGRDDRNAAGPRGDRGDRPHQTRTDRPAYGDRLVNADRAPQGDHADRPARTDHQARGERTDRPARGEHHNRADRPARPEHQNRDRPAHGDRNARSEHQPRGERPARGEHQHRAARPAHAERPAHADANAKPRHERGERQGQGAAPQQGGGEKQHWNGQKPPKFLNGNAPRSGGRPQAKPVH